MLGGVPELRSPRSRRTYERCVRNVPAIAAAGAASHRAIRPELT
jgi:hypothetical protein